MPLLVIPVIAVAFLALLAVLLYFAAEAFAHALAKCIPTNIPVIGSRVHDAVEGFADRAVNGIKLYFEVKLDLAAQLIKLPAIAIRVHLATILNSLQTLAHMGAYITRVYVPAKVLALIVRMNALYNEAIAFVRGQVAALIVRMNALYNEAIAFVRGQVAALIARMDVLYNNAVAFVRAEVAALIARMDALYNEAVAFVRGEIAALRADVAQLHAQALAYAHGIEVTLSHAIDQAYLKALGYVDGALPAAIKSALASVSTTAAAVWPLVWPDIQAGVRGVEDVLGDALPDIREAVRELEHAVPGDLAESLAVSGAVAGVLLRYLEKCGIPNCKNLGKLGHDFQSIIGAIEGGSLLAFLAEAVRDPEGTAEAAQRELIGPFTDAAQRFADLLGVK